MIHKIGFVFIVFFAVLGCGVDKNDPINLYNRYSKFENGLNFLSAKLDISSLENKNSFEISFSPNKIDVINLTPKSGLSNARISDGMISLNFKNGEKKSVEDSIWNRISSGIPENLGINPYSEFKSDIQPKLKKVSKDEILAIQMYDGKQIVQKVTFNQNKIEKSSTFVEDILLRETFYYDHIILNNDLYFPKRVLTIIYAKDKEPMRSEQNYTVNKIEML